MSILVVCPTYSNYSYLMDRANLVEINQSITLTMPLFSQSLLLLPAESFLLPPTPASYHPQSVISEGLGRNIRRL